MADFTFKYGAMGAGKTQELLRTLYNCRSKHESVLVLTPSIDSRVSRDVVVSRTGDTANAYCVEDLSSLSELFEAENLGDYALVLIDEVQFFAPEVLDVLKQVFVIQHNVPIVAYGLKTDFRGHLFAGSHTAFALADNVIEIGTVCQYCNNKATMNLRFSSDGEPTNEGAQILIGGSEAYAAVCAKCYAKKYNTSTI